MTAVAIRSDADALTQRLAAAADALSLDDRAGLDGADPGTLLDRLVHAVQAATDDSALWLVLTALTGVFPATDLVIDARRALQLAGPSQAALWLMDNTVDYAARYAAPRASMIVVRDRTLLDVGNAAAHHPTTDVQRVVREIAPRLILRYGLVPVAWTAEGGVFRQLAEPERDFLLRPASIEASEPRAPTRDVTIVVPWRTRVFVPDVPDAQRGERLAALARFSRCPVGLIGYDCIPAVSADLIGPDEREEFAQYLEVVKYVDRVAAVSASSADEFAGFVSALRTQGVDGPRVVRCPLPNASTSPKSPTPPPDAEVPVVLCIGGLSRRMNQVTVLDAAEVVWRSGSRFRLVLAGDVGDCPEDLVQQITELQQAGRDLIVRSDATDNCRRDLYGTARFAVLPSLHESFAFHVVESLAHAVPVITSRFGSMRECAEDQGGLVVDPESVDEIAEAMRTLLDDDVLLGKLRTQAEARPLRSWDDYAVDLWSALTESDSVGADNRSAAVAE